MRRLALPALLLALTTPVAAQSWLYAVINEAGPTPSRPSGGPALLVEVDVTSGQVGGLRRMARLSTAGAVGGPVVTSDQRYVVGSIGFGNPNDVALALFDRLTGLAVPVQIQATSFLLSDPSRIRLFALTGNPLAARVIDGTGAVRILTTSVSSPNPYSAIISPDGRRLYVFAQGQLVGLDTDTGNVVISWPLPPDHFGISTVLSRDGRLLYAGVAVSGANAYLAIFDTVTGSIMTTAALPVNLGPALALDDASGRLFAVLNNNASFSRGSRLMAFDGQTLGTVFDGGERPERQVQIFSDPSSATMTLAGLRGGLTFCSGAAVIETWSTNPVARISQVVAPYPYYPCPSFTYAAPPRAPTLAVTVSGRTVSLSWLHTWGATSFSLEAGSAPGLTNITQFAATGSGVTVPDVPPGTYYVRLRGINAVGTGPGSNEVIVTVQ